VADPLKEWWTMADIADHWGVELGTIWDYRYQTNHPKTPGQAPKLPTEDDTIGRTPVWRPQTIIGFERPGQGHGGGPKPDRAENPGTAPEPRLQRHPRRDRPCARHPQPD
jgi:hypothetical protein